jgi:GNAT superfamily N-acetyltransferase
VFWIGVAQSSQRSGLGRAILEKAEIMAKTAEARRVMICTSSLPSTAPARALYTKCGYSQVGAAVPDFYGEDKITFSKAL